MSYSLQMVSLTDEEIAPVAADLLVLGYVFPGQPASRFSMQTTARKWPLVAVIAAVLTIVMAPMCIEPATVSIHRTRCQRNGRERKEDRKADLSYHGDPPWL